MPTPLVEHSPNGPATADAVGTSSRAGAAPVSEGLRERKKRETRQRLHRAAVDITHEVGPSAVTTEQISQRAGVSPRTFFNYFASKEAAIVGVSLDLVDRANSELGARPTGEGVLDALEALVRDRVAGLLSDPALVRRRAEVFARWPELIAAAAGSATSLQRSLTAAVAARLGLDPRTDPLPSLYVGFALAVMRAALATPDADLDTSISAGFTMLRTGLEDRPLRY